MLTNLDSSSEYFLASLARVQQRLAKASQQVSSGRKVSVASDAPDIIDSLMQLRADRSRNQQIQTNLGLAKTDVAAADQTLTVSIRLLDRALVLANQGASGTMDASGRQGLAQEAQSLLEQMVAGTQTAVQGRYIFSGDQEETPPYHINTAGAVEALSTACATLHIEDPAGGSFVSRKTAAEIFDPRDVDGNPLSDNVFAALQSLRDGLLANDQAAVTSSVTSIKSASGRLNTMQAFYGTVENRIQAASDYADHYDIDLRTQLSQKQDADVTEAALELTQATTQMQAAFQMRAKLPRTSLFDYLG